MKVPEMLTPAEIERRSFALIEQELARPLDPALAPIILRVIHATADFDFADTLRFSPGALEAGLAALEGGQPIITDTDMARAGINKGALAQLHTQALCFMADEDVAQAAAAQGTTRAAAAVDKAARLPGRPIFVIGNAPTALLRLCQLIRQEAVAPSLIVAVPVGFVNVVEAKAQVPATRLPHILAQGRKGGSTVAAAVVNGLMYLITRGAGVK
jgi:precorrin-8X/cobalt-precorrin-8 methylmutase